MIKKFNVWNLDEETKNVLKNDIIEIKRDSWVWGESNKITGDCIVDHPYKQGDTVYIKVKTNNISNSGVRFEYCFKFNTSQQPPDAYIRILESSNEI